MLPALRSSTDFVRSGRIVSETKPPLVEGVPFPAHALGQLPLEMTDTSHNLADIEAFPPYFVLKNDFEIKQRVFSNTISFVCFILFLWHLLGEMQLTAISLRLSVASTWL
jgi:hypothetical protein